MISHQVLAHRAAALHAGAVFVLALCAGCARTGAVQDDDSTVAVQRPFDSGAWISGTAGVRGQMAGDLIEHSLLLGKTRSEVTQLLGAPDQEGTAFLRYDVLSGADNTAGSAYAIRVELDARSGVTREVRVDTGVGPEYAGPD
jgi:hypothetical protein